jgi:pyrroline-5-carboxylate reductase
MLREQCIGFIGGGNMSEALIGGLIRTGRARPEQLLATDIVPARREFLATRFSISASSDNRLTAARSQILVLSVEPQHLDAVLGDIHAEAGPDKLIVSVAAGYPIARISRHLPGSRRIVRAMPNTPSIIGEGVTALARAPGLTDEDAVRAESLFESVGKVVMLEERLMDAVTGLSGSGPAYVYMMIEALADGGVKMGLPRHTAAMLAVQTVAGAAHMILSSEEHPAVLKDRVASPGGTTIAGLHELENGRLRAALMSAVEAAAGRSSELGKESLSTEENESCNIG